MRAAICALVLLMTFGLAHAQTPVPQPPAPQPFVATYAATYRGINAGTLTFSFQRDAASGHYIYETRANPSLLARFVVSRDALERSEMQIGPDGVRPLNWQLDDGKSGAGKDGQLQFDWANDTVSGVIEDEKISLPTQSGLQDRLSIQVAVIAALLRGNEPGTIPMIDDNRIKHYIYTRGAAETIETPMGTFDTIVYESTRSGSSRVSRFWMAPQFEYVPVRAEQVRKGKVETVMVLTKLEGGSDQGEGGSKNEE